MAGDVRYSYSFSITLVWHKAASMGNHLRSNALLSDN